MTTDAARFLSSLFPEKLNSNEYILIWTKKGDGPGMVKDSAWLNSAMTAAVFAAGIYDRDVYFGMGLSPKDYGPHQRGLAENVVGIPGLWIDIDVQTGIHKNGRLPATVVEAHGLILECGLEPSIIVHSGGGLQAYWLFDEFVRFRDSDHRKEIQTLSEKWIYYFKGLAAPHSWEIDSVQDLARVMRVPGTQNFKDAAGPRPVKILELNENVKYNPQDLANLLDGLGVEVPQKNKSVRAVDGAVVTGTQYQGLVFDPNAKYDSDLFESICENEPGFLRSWHHKKKEIGDSTCSGYDLSLATYWLNAGYEVQSCVDMLIQHRRKYGNPKVDKHGGISADYYRRTLARAKATPDEFNRVRFEQDQEDASGEGSDLPPAPVEPPIDKQGEIEKLSRELEVQILAAHRVMGDTPYFRIDFLDCSLTFTDAGGIISQTKFRERVATATKKVIKNFGKERWNLISQRILKLCGDVAPDPLETGPGWMRYYVKEYLESREVVQNTSLEAVSGDPFFWREWVWITVPKFQEWVKRKELTAPVKYSEALTGAGFIKDVRNVGEGETTTTRTAWRVPMDVYKFIVKEKEEI